MGIFEGITHSEETQKLLSDAQSQYDNAKKRLENQRKSTTKSLEKLGENKVHAWSKDMSMFLVSFGAFNNVQIVCKIDEDYEFLGKNETPNEIMVNMRNATYNADEIIQAGALAVGAGALVGIATYGGVAMFANASTGTAIASLNGAAKKNATLAWLGGGSIETGGAGIAGGSVVLGGVVIGAIALVGGLIAGAMGKAKLAEAKRVHAEAESAVSKMNVVITDMQGIEKISNNYRDFISKISELFTPYLKELDSIAQKYQRGSDGKVDFNDLSEMEQKTLHLSWLLAQLYYHILSVPLLNSQGEVEPSSRQLLQKAQRDYAQLSGQATELEIEKNQIKEILLNAKSEFKTASIKYYKKKNTTTDLLITIGKKRIDLWERTFSPLWKELSNFENIRVNNIYPYSVTDIPIEFIFESTNTILSSIMKIRNTGMDSLGRTGLVEVALFGGEDYLAELLKLEAESGSVCQVHRHDMSMWFSDEMDPIVAANIEFGDVSENSIAVVGQVVDGISGRENLEQASEINRIAKDLSDKISNAVSAFDRTVHKIRRIETSLKKYNKIQSEFIQAIGSIRERYQTPSEVVQYDLLSESEKRIFEMSFIIAKIQYSILASCLLSPNNGGDMDDTDVVVNTANNVYKSIQRDFFKMKEKEDLEVVNIVWGYNATKALVAGFISSLVCIVLAILQLSSRNMIGLVGIVGAAVAFPIFFYYKNLPQNKLFMWRCIRIAVAFAVVIVTEIVRLVV